MNKPRRKNGDIETIDGVERVFYDGYWVRHYRPPPNSLAAKKQLIDMLTRRTFHHTEAGINTPGQLLEVARAAWESEADPLRKRVNAAMLAGALFNRATDIFTAIVELEERGVHIARDNQLMRECADAFTEALALCGQVKHSSGEAGVDELWGEPVKAFSMPVAEYYASRYRKTAQAMHALDEIRGRMHETLCSLPWFDGARKLIDAFVEAAKSECEIFRSDTDYYRVWPAFVAAGETLLAYRAHIPPGASSELERHIKRGTRLLQDGKNLIAWIADVRVPMPNSSIKYAEQCAQYRAACKKFLAE